MTLYITTTMTQSSVHPRGHSVLLGHRRAMTVVCGALLTLISQPVKAQAGGWVPQRDEYYCSGVKLETGAQSTWVSKPIGDRSAALRVEFNMPMTTVKIPPGSRPALFAGNERIPPHTVSDYFNNSDRMSFTVEGDAALYDWFAKADRAIAVTYAGVAVATISATRLAEGGAAAAACEPIKPPPNRAVTPKGDTKHWVGHPADLARSFPGRSQIGPIAAEVYVDSRGAVSTCKITQTSGIPMIDSRICEWIKSNARFVAATDARGQHIGSVYQYNSGEIILK